MLRSPTPCALPLGDSGWQRRRPERSILYRVIQDELDTLIVSRDHPSRAPLPRFIQREFVAFLACGIAARGFLRIRCDGCHREQILPFSCKGRGFCPSCCHRRMLDQQAHITEAVLPDLPLRQFVFTFPFALRYRMAFDPKLCADVRRVVMRALFGFYRQRAIQKNLPPGPTGSISATQRFASALNVNPHFHILCFDGVFSPDPAAGLDGFHYTGDPTPEQIERLLAECIARVERLLRKRGILVDDGAADPAEEDPELAACLHQSVLDRQRVHRRDDARAGRRSGPWPRLLARDRGYTLHADTAIAAYDATRRDLLVRYVLRPPFAPSQIELTADGRVSFRLAHPFDDGTTHLLWSKQVFLSRLAALIPRPRRHLVTYHGVLAPNHTLRAGVVRKSRAAQPGRRGKKPRCTPRPRLRHDQLLLRSYGFLFRRCDHCGGNKRVLAVITNPDAIAKILTALGLDPHPPPRAPPATYGDFP